MYLRRTIRVLTVLVYAELSIYPGVYLDFLIREDGRNARG